MCIRDSSTTCHPSSSNITTMHSASQKAWPCWKRFSLRQTRRDSPDGLTSDLAWLPQVREATARSTRFIVTIGEARTFGNRILYLSVEGTNLAQLHQSLSLIHI